jgi:chorismate-pyruvate lyase
MSGAAGFPSQTGRNEGGTLSHPRHPSTVLLAAVSLLAGAGGAHAALPDGFVARLRAMALLETFNADLLSHDSATQTLQRWCDERGVAPGAHIVARRVRGADKAADEAVRRDLDASAAEPIRYRRVQLVCGDHVLSEADNWYLPGRLTPEMNRQLDETDRPFGAVVAGLGFHRRTLSANLLFRPLPEGWERQAAPSAESVAPMVVPPRVLEHRAVLSTAAGAPFSLVVETYTAEVLATER